MNRLAVVVLNWNDIDNTRLCLDGLRKQTIKTFDIILVDNGSTQRGTKTFLKNVSKQGVIVFKNEKNLGFAGGVNTGLRYVLENEYDFVTLINNDAYPNRDWLSILRRQAIEASSGITTGLLLHEQGETIDSSGDMFSIWGLPFPRDRNKPKVSHHSSGDVFSGSGGGSLYSVDMLRDIGLFDEVFFAYYEDVDISFRAQLRGYDVCYIDSAICRHKRGVTSDKIPGLAIKHTFKNLPILYTKNLPWKLFWKYLLRFKLAYFLMLGNTIRNGHFKYAFIGSIMGFYYFWTHALPSRFKIQKRRTTSSSYIDKILYKDLPPEQAGLRKVRSFFIRLS